MNYLKQILAFERLSEANCLNATDRSLYYALIHKNNELGWIKTFTFANSSLLAKSGIKDIKTLFRSRQRLIQQGVIEYNKGKGGKAPSYQLFDLGMVIGTDIGTVIDRVIGTVTGTVIGTDTLNKQNKIKQNKKEKYKKEKDSDTDLSGESNSKLYKQIIDYLNQTIGSNYKYHTKATKQKIDARLNEGFTLDDFKSVIYKKAKEWKGTDMENYLRPETLFGNKFEGYLNQRTVNTSSKNKMQSKNAHDQRKFDNIDEFYD